MLLAMTETAYLWVEGVDFDATLFDTSDLSTVRGSSLALLRLGDVVIGQLRRASDIAVDRVFNGASQAAYRLTGAMAAINAATADALARLNAEDGRNGLPCAHLSIVHGLGFVGPAGADAALKAAQAKARAMQQRKISVPPAVEAEAKRPCAFDRLRGAAVPIPLGSTDGKPDIKLASRSVAARRAFGRAQRQAFYRDLLPAELLATAGHAVSDGDARFADSFEEIVADPPDWVPAGARNKIAVLYLDGNGFGAVRDRIAKNKGLAAALTLFSDQLTALQRTRLLPGALRAAPWDGSPKARFETLLWGGDEVRFVVPAWRALDLATAVMTDFASGGWSIEGETLTFTGGLVIANYKTPIASLVRATEDLVDTLKDADRDASQIAIEVLESVEIPADGVVAGRSRLLGLAPGDPAAYFALAGANLEETVEQIRGLKQSLPASQLQRWLREGRTRRRFASNENDQPVRDAIAAYENHGGGSGWVDRLTLPDGVHERSLVWDMLLTSVLWDYVAKPPEAGADI